MPCLSLAYWIYALLLAGLAVCWADVLVRPGGLLAGAQRGLRAWHQQRYMSRWLVGGALGEPIRYATGTENRYWDWKKDLDSQWWWPPLWGCYKCVAGQWGFWAYLWLFRAAPYSLLSHLGFAAATIILSLILSKWSQEA